MDDSTAVSNRFNDCPELESALPAILRVDEANEYCSFDEGSGKTAYEHRSGSHMRLEETKWADCGVSFESRDAF